MLIVVGVVALLDKDNSADGDPVVGGAPSQSAGATSSTGDDGTANASKEPTGASSTAVVAEPLAFSATGDITLTQQAGFHGSKAGTRTSPAQIRVQCDDQICTVTSKDRGGQVLLAGTYTGGDGVWALTEPPNTSCEDEDSFRVDSTLTVSDDEVRIEGEVQPFYFSNSKRTCIFNPNTFTYAAPIR